MKWEQSRSRGNGQDRTCLSREQEMTFRSMVLLPKQDRREILDMVIMYELVEDRPEGKAIRAQL